MELVFFYFIFSIPNLKRLPPSIKAQNDISKTFRVVAKDAKTGKQIKLSYVNKKVTGNGSFGVVYQTRLLETNEDAAIKKVLQDRRFKVRDLSPFYKFFILKRAKKNKNKWHF